MCDGGARARRILAGEEKPPACQEVSLAGRPRREPDNEVWVCPICDKPSKHGQSWEDHWHGPDKRDPWAKK